MVSKDKEIAKIMAELNAKYKKEVIIKGAKETIERISTGLVSVDKLLGGGIPRKRFTMIYGPKGVAKTTLCYKIMALVQESGGKVVYIDAEHAYDPKWAKSLGIDIDSLIFNSPGSLEEAMTVIRKMAPIVDLIVLDSIVAVAAEQEIEREMEQDTMALIPRKLSQFFRIVTSILGKSNAAVILVNQTRVDLGAYVPIDRYPGGRALSHYVSFIMKMRRLSPKDWPTEKVDKKDVPMGIRIALVAEKSKVSPTEGMNTCFDLLKKEPHFDEYSDLFLAAEMEGLIIHTGAWYNIDGVEDKFQGRDAVIEALKNDNKLFNRLHKEVMKNERR